MNQENMSMQLQVTRSQWSMHILGKRDLPVAAKLKLAEMLVFLKRKLKHPKILNMKKNMIKK